MVANREPDVRRFDVSRLAVLRIASVRWIVLLVMAQTLDLLTYSPAHELNVLVTPVTALPLKVALLVLVLAVATIGYRRLVLGAGIAAGFLGFASNVGAGL